jgi:hypothetical protein
MPWTIMLAWVLAQSTLLDQLVGTWTAEGTTRGQPSRYRIDAQRILQGKYVELRWTDIANNPPQYDARVIIGESSRPGEVIAHWIDNTGAENSVPPATGRISGDTLFLDFPYPDGAFRDTFVLDRAHHAWHIRLESADGSGGWRLFADYQMTGR